MIKILEEKQKISEVGGKAWNLSELCSLVPVPQGFTVTTKGFRTFLRENDIEKKVSSILKQLKNNSKSVEEASSELKNLILKSNFPEELKKEIMKAYDEIKEDKKGFAVAVRSSAVDEDNPKASFAGQHDTHLNINREELIEAVKKCFASLYNKRALHYRKRKDMLKHDIEIAVVVQRMVNPKASGVMFTRDPVTRDDTKIMIETVPGLGEQLVQGKATPDFYKVDKSSREILEERIVTQEKEYTKDEETEKLTEKEINREEGETPWLTKNQINKLVDYGKKIEQHYNSPQDIEWVLDKKGKIQIVQSRPETSKG